MKTYISLLVACLLLTACNSDSIVSSQDSGYAESGQGGSLARFIVKGDYLYSVDLYGLHVFNIADLSNPVEVNSVPIGFNIETLFAYKEYLYIGSRNGMYIYSVQNPELPQYLSDVQHFTSCDPVVANDTYAFVTLHADIGCGNTINVLETYDVTDIVNPILISSRNLTQPIGLGLYGDYLFVCDDEVKIFDMSDPASSTLVNSINRNGFDVIIHQDLLILIGENGLYQFSLNPNDIQDITELSTLNI
ncbi:LVIVD repeat-containing protein [Mangrovimonas xylaniphaga]|uniref:LVIVD repeat-containing protein n=1 Tax=Mangrovimonas xylaniphaga TaxID=1645915 RepID=UPI000A8953D4|nr:hypothetical protein [Mangrovimonas xylaniphaga]